MSSQVEPPSHVIVLPGPLDSEQVLSPAQVELQLAPHWPVHIDWPAQVLVHRGPQLVVQVLRESQL